MNKKDFILFLIASAFIGMSQSIDSSVLNNFLNDTYNITISQRTILEIPREFPGFMVVFLSSILLFLGDIRIAAIANILSAFGILGVAFFSPTLISMLPWMILYSTGTHLFLPVSNSIAITLSNQKDFGKKLGQINGVNTAAFLVTSIITALLFKQFKVNYKISFVFIAIAYAVSSVLIFTMTKPYQKQSKKKLFFRKEYSLFYFLSIVYGARKQIFITFGPWVLIKVFHQGVSTFAFLGFIIAGIGMFFKPFVGTLIDRKGEKFILASEAVILTIICIGYASAEIFCNSIGNSTLALYIVCICFVVDQLLTAAGMARATYLKKIIISDEDISPTLSMGITIDHLVAMFVPFLGGYIWIKYGYQCVFIGGAFIAIINLFLTSKIKLSSNDSTSISS